MQVNWQFDANQFDPNQGFGVHPPAQKIPFGITNTAIKETAAKDGSAYLEVEFTTPLGTIRNIYNVKNNSPKATEIAYGQLSALCRSVGIYNIDGNNECAALRGGKGLMDVGYQKNEEPGPNNPNAKGYTEIKRVYDASGNEPGKAPAQPQTQAQPQGQQAQGQQAAQTQPLTQQAGGGWGNAPQQNNAAQQQPQANPNPAPNGAGGGWQPGANGAGPGGAPPWGARQ